MRLWAVQTPTGNLEMYERDGVPMLFGRKEAAEGRASWLNDYERTDGYRVVHMRLTKDPQRPGG